MAFSIPSITIPSININPAAYGIPTVEDLAKKVISKAPSIESLPKVEELKNKIESKVPNIEEYKTKGEEILKMVKGEEPDIEKLTGMHIPTEEELMSQSGYNFDPEQYVNIGNDIPDFENEEQIEEQIEEYFKSLSL